MPYARFGTLMTGTYDPILVTLSVLVAVLASYTALDLAGRVTAARGRVRLAWLAGGSIAMGVGIWSMHFVGMLAFRLPVPMSYDVPLWLMSVGVAVGASAFALSVVGRDTVSAGPLLASALLMGAAIAGMHYVGMAAMRIPGRIGYDPLLVAASVAIAVVASFAALWLAFRLRKQETQRGQWLRAGSAVAMGFAISGMHYTGMAAARFTPVTGAMRVPGDNLLATDGLAASVVIGTLLILAVALLGAVIDRRLRARAIEVEAVRRSENRFRSLVVATSQIVWTTSPTGESESEQPGWSAFTGQTPEEYRGLGWFDAVHPEDRARTIEIWSAALRECRPYELEHRLRRRDGEYRHMWARGAPVLAADGRVREWVGIHSDITEEKRAERRAAAEHAVTRVLAESQSLEDAAPKLLRSVCETLDWDVGALWSVDGDVLRCTDLWHAPAVRVEAFERDTRERALPRGVGLPGRVWEGGEPVWISDVAGISNFPRIRAAVREGLHGALAFPLRVGDEFVGVAEFFTPEAPKPNEAVVRTMDAIGSEIGQFVRRRRAEEERDRALREVRALATERDAVLRQTADGVIFTDPDGTIVFVNEAARRIHGAAELGIPVEDYTERYHLLTTSGEPYPPAELPLARAVRGETVTDAEWRIRRPDGTEVIAQGSSSPVVSDDGSKLGAVLTLRDVTEQHHLRRQLEAERARLREIFMKAPALISVTRGPEHVFELVNPFYQRIVGGRPMVGKTLREALPELEGQGFFEMRDRLYASGETHVQNEARVLADLDDDGRLEEHFLSFVTQPLRDAEGRVEGILTFAVEVTEQVHARRVVEEQATELEANVEELQSQATELEEMQAELEMANDELRRANEELYRGTEEAEVARAEAEAANRTKSDFLATMSHELRTPLNAVLGYTDLLEMGILGPVTEGQLGQLARIRASAQHLIALVGEILDLAKVEAGRMNVAHERAPAMNAVTAALALVMPQATARGIVIEDSCAEDPSTVYTGDEHRVQQILLNLLSNAVKFTEPGGRVRIACGTTDVPDPAAQLPEGGSWAFVRVEDTGIGIAPQDLAAVFEPFVQVESGFTRTRGGTGLGLSISRRLARLMSGDLTARSELGGGSVFTLWLPNGNPAGNSPGEATPAEVREGGSGSRGFGEIGEIGEAVHGEIDAILRAFVARLRADPLVPQTEMLTDAEIEDHTPSFLANIAQSLVILEQTGGKPAMMRDGSEIQRLIAERHGAQRARLGWTEEALRREFEILKEEVDAAVRRKVPATSDTNVNADVAVLARFLDHSERISLGGFRAAASANGA